MTIKFSNVIPFPTKENKPILMEQEQMILDIERDLDVQMDIIMQLSLIHI